MEEIRISKCRKNYYVDNINEDMQGSSSEEEETGIRNFLRRI